MQNMPVSSVLAGRYKASLKQSPQRQSTKTTQPCHKCGFPCSRSDDPIVEHEKTSDRKAITLQPRQRGQAPTPPGPERQCCTSAVCATVQFNTLCALLFNHKETQAKPGVFHVQCPVFQIIILDIFHVNVFIAPSQATDSACLVRESFNMWHSNHLLSERYSWGNVP